MENARTEPPQREPSPYKRDPKNRGSVTGGLEDNPWKENHGNLLLGFAAVVCLVGAGIIACRQFKFVPPKFPTNLGPEARVGVDIDVDAEPSDTATSFKVKKMPLSIIGAGSDEGVMKIAVYISAESFNDPEQAFETDRWKIVDGVCAGTWEVPVDLKQMAIAAYHDENGNDELDRNRLGIPTERYGFSANARGLTGPPAFSEAAIEPTTEPIEISIR